MQTAKDVTDQPNMDRTHGNAFADVVDYAEREPAFKPIELPGVTCKKCGSQPVFRSRPRPEDTFKRWAGFMSCRCGTCFARFQVWSLWPRKRVPESAHPSH